MKDPCNDLNLFNGSSHPGCAWSGAPLFVHPHLSRRQAVVNLLEALHGLRLEDEAWSPSRRLRRPPTVSRPKRRRHAEKKGPLGMHVVSLFLGFARVRFVW